MVQHCEQETLALLALGEPAASTEDDRHLAGCSACQHELAELRSVVTTSRAITPGDRPVSPPPAVWDRITKELGLSTALPATHPVELTLVDESAPVVSLDDRRRARPRRTGLLAAAAAVIGVAAGIGGTALVRSSNEPAAPVVIASTNLKPLSAADASGIADLHTSATGHILTVSVTGLRHASDGFYEVWLADKDTKKMLSIGVLDGTDHGTFDVPDGLDLATYRVVDVSLETFDGDPLHSAVSVVRGTFPA